MNEQRKFINACCFPDGLFMIVNSPHTPSRKDLKECMYLACSCGNLNIVKYLISTYQIHPGHYELERASSNGHFEVVQLITKYVKSDYKVPIEYASMKGHREIREFLFFLDTSVDMTLANMLYKKVDYKLEEHDISKFVDTLDEVISL